MTDTIVKGSGNSRKLITVPNAPTLYPDHETLMQKWATEGIPVDIGPLLAIGCDVIGTMLNKANVLPDSVEKELWGTAANRTLAQALSRLKALTDPVSGKLDAEMGSYVGTQTKPANQYQEFSTRKQIVFGIDPKLVIVCVGNRSGNSPTPLVCLKPNPYAASSVGGGTSTYNTLLDISWSSKSITISMTGTGDYAYLGHNIADVPYYYIAIG